MNSNKTLNLDLHSIISIRATGLIDEVWLPLKKNFGMFVIDSVETEGIKADIELSQLETAKLPDLKPPNKNLSGMWVKGYDNELFVVLGYRGRADVVIRLSSPVELLYTPRQGCFNKLFHGILLAMQMVLNVKNGVLFHGAVVCSGDDCILLTGPGGAGKTILVLNMLQEGWDYLSDDKCILFNGRTYLFRSYIPLRDYHYQTFPWLLEKCPQDTKIYNKARYRQWFKRFAERHLPGYVLSPLEDFYNPVFEKNLSELFPQSNILSGAEPSIWIILVPDSKSEFVRIQKEEAVRRIGAIQCLDFPEYDKMTHMLDLYGCGIPCGMNTLIESHLKDLRVYRMSVPYNTDGVSLYRNFKRCLKQVL